MRLKQYLLLILVLLLVMSKNTTLFAQEAAPEPEPVAALPEPPMKNVFMNVLWGSLAGGMAVAGWSTLDDSKTKEERYSVSNLIGQFVYGATLGGIAGLGAGVYFSLMGVTFEPAFPGMASTIGPTPEFHHNDKNFYNEPAIAIEETFRINFEMKF